MKLNFDDKYKKEYEIEYYEKTPAPPPFVDSLTGRVVIPEAPAPKLKKKKVKAVKIKNQKTGESFIIESATIMKAPHNYVFVDPPELAGQTPADFIIEDATNEEKEKNK